MAVWSMVGGREGAGLGWRPAPRGWLRARTGSALVAALIAGVIVVSAPVVAPATVPNVAAAGLTVTAISAGYDHT